MSNREKLELYGDNLIVFENPDYDSAIIGVTHDDRVVYDYDKMIVSLMDTDGMSAEEAAEFIDYNTIRAIPYAGEGAPVVIYRNFIGHGHWISRKYFNLGYYIHCCSECRHVENARHNYCPHCGIKMDLEDSVCQE